MKCEKCNLEKPDVSMRIFGGMSHNYCNDCNQLMLSTQGVLDNSHYANSHGFAGSNISVSHTTPRTISARHPRTGRVTTSAEVA